MSFTGNARALGSEKGPHSGKGEGPSWRNN